MTTPLSETNTALDRVLRVLEHGQHSATELRVLLRLADHRDAGIGDLAEQLGCRPTEITRAGRRLAVRGLVRTHRAGRPEQTLMEITPSGLATVRTLLTAARVGVATGHRWALTPMVRMGALGHDAPHELDEPSASQSGRADQGRPGLPLRG